VEEKTGAITVSHDPNAQKAAQTGPPPQPAPDPFTAGHADGPFKHEPIEPGSSDRTVTFEVKPGDDNGYQSSSTLSEPVCGPNLRDVASAVSVVNRTFMDDLNAHNLDTLLKLYGRHGSRRLGRQLFRLGASSPVIYGLVDKFGELEHHSADAHTRSAGRRYDAATFFCRSYRWTTSTWTGRDKARGERDAFGLGSPAGIINQTLITANTDKNAYELRNRSAASGPTGCVRRQ